MENKFLDRLLLMKKKYGKALEPVCGHYGLTRMEMDILLYLKNNPDADTATDMVERRGLSKSHVSASLQALEEKGLIERFFCQNNRKTVHLKPSASAETITQAGREAQCRFFEDIFRGISQEDREHLRRILEKIHENMEEKQE